MRHHSWMSNMLFIHGELNEDVHFGQPKGYVKKGEEHKVYKLQSFVWPKASTKNMVQSYSLTS